MLRIKGACHGLMRSVRSRYLASNFCGHACAYRSRNDLTNEYEIRLLGVVNKNHQPLLSFIRCEHRFSEGQEATSVLKPCNKNLVHELHSEDELVNIDNIVVDKDKNSQEDEYEDFVLEDNTVHEEMVEQVHPISLERGLEGVFDVEEVVTVLQEQNASNICTIHVPKERNYVDYLVIVTGRSRRHLLAMAEYLRKLYKLKRSPEDVVSVLVEGKGTDDWMALDLGNVAVHLFRARTRELYDLESLWTLGEEYDENIQAENNQQDPYTFLFDGSKDEKAGDEDVENVTKTENTANASGGEHEEVQIESFASHSSKWHETES